MYFLYNRKKLKPIKVEKLMIHSLGEVLNQEWFLNQKMKKYHLPL